MYKKNYFDFEFLEKSLKFWAAEYRSASNPLILQKAACIEICLLFADTLLFD